MMLQIKKIVLFSHLLNEIVYRSANTLLTLHPE